MRATLDIDEDVLEAAEELAERQETRYLARSFPSLFAGAYFALTCTPMKNLSPGSIAS